MCDVTPTAVDGPLSPADYFHTANEIGLLLGLVARGTSLRGASQAVRRAAGRSVPDAAGTMWTSRECGLAARSVDLFGATIERELGPDRWPAILVLDAKPFGLRAYGAAEHGEIWDSSERAGTALIAAGGDDPKRPLSAWRIGLAGDETAASWSDFLAELPGEPVWVVTDGSEALRIAVKKRWPKANLYACEFHLGQALRKAASADGIWPDDPLHQVRFERAFWTEADWNALVELVLDATAPTLFRWVAANDALIRRQLALRRRCGGFPRSNGAPRAGCRLARHAVRSPAPLQSPERQTPHPRVRPHPGRARRAGRPGPPGPDRQARARRPCRLASRSTGPPSPTGAASPARWPSS